jgi:hypothetical protein
MNTPQFIQLQNLSFEDYWKKITEIVELVIKKNLSQQHQIRKERLLSRNQASAYFGITPPTLDSYERDGILVSYKIKGRKFFKLSELNKALTNSKKS